MEEEVVAFVHGNWPLVMARTCIAPQLKASNVEVVACATLEAPLFCIDRTWLARAIGRPLSPNVDYTAVSIMDLWWATVS